MPEHDALWWTSFYDDAFADVVMDRGEDAGCQATAEFLLERLRLRPGDTVFDQCCGIGRLSVPLARRGVRVIGVDVIEGYILRATAAAEALALPCEFFVGDAFRFQPERSCDGAFNWWSSFGYTEDDDRNAEMLRRAFHALKPGGRFALEYYSTPWLLREFQERLEIRYSTEHGEFPVVREARLRFETGMIDQRWRYTGPDGAEHIKTSATRMYLPHELRRLLLESGFTDVELYGGPGGEPFTLSSPRCILVAQRPGVG
jgi:SAM-dependent methyltransferase